MTHDQQIRLDRWVQTLSSYGWDAALQHGKKSYLDGTVRQIRFTSGGLLVKTCGLKTRPETIQIAVRHFEAAEWQKVLNVLASKALYAAMLLNGKMPESLERHLSVEGVQIIPENNLEWNFTCTCGEQKQNAPCIHAAAAFLALGNEWARDPWLLFEMRGKSREEILQQLRVIRSRLIFAMDPQLQKVGRSSQPDEQSLQPLTETILSESLPLEMHSKDTSQMSFSSEDAWLLNRAGEPEFWNKDVPMRELFAPIYRKVALRAFELTAVPNINKKKE